MKQKVLLFSILIAIFFIEGCTKGPIGPTGATGATGSTGPQGPQGNPGTANVTYSKWIKVDSSMWTHTASDSSYSANNGSDTTINFHTVLQMPNITQGILDSGVVYYYFKDSASTDPMFGQVTQMDVTGFSPFAFATNRAFNSAYYTGAMGYFIYFENSSNIIGNVAGVGFYELGKLSLKITWEDNNVWFQNYHYISHNELAPKTKFCIRSVTIPGGKLSGGRLIANARAAGVDFKKYESVKSYFHIKD